MTTYDFIVVGAGASGCVLASRLANSRANPSVLLLEAGGENNNVAHLSAAERFNVAFSPGSPLNWGYKTAPQTQLDGQVIDYSRGKGLGGSTAINFCGWTVGPRDDYDRWAEVVGDEHFAWANVKSCLQKIENLRPEIPDGKYSKYVEASREDHSSEGKLHLTYGDEWRSDIEDIYLAAEQSGLRINRDVNDGDPIGMGMGSVCIYQGQRLTSANAYLSKHPANLTIKTDTMVSKVLVNNGIANGVQTLDGCIYTATKEVILSGGALNTPQLLMLSGIGPSLELEKHSIPVVKVLPAVGKNLQDHCFSPIGTVLTRNETTPSVPQQCPTPMGWLKLPAAIASPEFDSLPEETKTHLLKPTVPMYEIATHTPPAFVNHTPHPDTDFIGAISLVMNPQSTGTVTLKSSNPSDALLVDPNFLSHPYDRRVLVEGIRETSRLLSAPVFAGRTVEKIGPDVESDEEIWEWARRNLHSSWHMSCTVKMGRSEDDACVDSEFRVFGVRRLRVVDLSVCPFVVNNHVQSVAYVLGEIAAQKLSAEYGLDG